MSNRFDDRNDLSETDKELRWDKIHSRGGTRDDIRNQYAGWLEQDNRIIDLLERCNSPILDLGCGIGIDTLHLVENGHQVVACDFSKEALDKVKQNIPEASTLKFNMKESIPFNDETFEFIIANKSIHYFSKQETISIIKDLHRILKPGGVFAFVVNSTKDSNFGAGQGEKIEENFYEVRGTTKRFFDKEALETFFDSEHWEIIYMSEGEINSDRIKTVQLQNDGKTNKKITWTCIVRRK